MLGHGGMGCVYLAEQLNLERLVALKIVAMGPAASPDLHARFREESRSVAAISHPGVCQIYEVGQANDLPFISMEYIQGTTLLEHLRNQLPSANQAAQLVIEIADAVEACHQAGILHRDLKPENVMLTHDGIVKVMDFGLAKRVQGKDQYKTQTGRILGTPNYMSPEQASAVVKQLTPACDVYAIGAILYELLSGRPPFQTPDPMQTIMLVLTEEPLKLRKLQPKIPIDLETICHKCLEKKPGKRYQSARELADDLQRFLDQRPILARRTPIWEQSQKWIRRHPTYSALLTTLVSAGLAALIGVSFHVSRLQVEIDRAERLFGADQKFVGWLVNDYIPEIAKVRSGSRQQEDLVDNSLLHLRELELDIAADDTLAEYIAQAYLRIAEVQADPFFESEVRLEQALSSYRNALELYDKITYNASLQTGDTISSRIGILIAMVDLNLRLNRTAEAEERVEAAFQLHETSDKSDPQLQLLKLKLENILITIQFQQDNKTPEEALRNYRLLEAEAKQLQPRLHSDPNINLFLAQLSLRIAEVISDADADEITNPRELRIKNLSNAVDQLARLPLADLQTTYLQSTTRTRLASLLYETGQRSQADLELKASLELMRGLINELPQSPLLLQSFLESLELQTEAELSRPDLAAALASAQEHLAVSEKLYLSSPDEYRSEYRNSFELMAEVQRNRQRYEAAAEALLDAADLARKDPNKTDLLNLARLLNSRAELLVASAQERSIAPERLNALQQAIAILKESIKIYEQASLDATSEPDSPYWKAIARLHEYEAELEQILLRSRERVRSSPLRLEPKQSNDPPTEK